MKAIVAAKKTSAMIYVNQQWTWLPIKFHFKESISDRRIPDPVIIFGLITGYPENFLSSTSLELGLPLGFGFRRYHWPLVDDNIFKVISD